MDGTPQTSFIPKKPLTDNGPQKSGKVSIATLAAIIIFMVTLALAAGVFIYKGILKNGIASKKISLERARSAFDPALIQALRRLDKRLESSKSLLRDHVALSALFDTLEAATSENIRYSSLDWNGGDSKKLLLTMRGEAKSYASVAFESRVLAKTNLIKEPAFSDLNLDDQGRIVFTLSAVVDPEAIRFSNLPERTTSQSQ